jgi:hypothetical protein
LTDPRRLSGNELFYADGNMLDVSLLHFWQWSASDLRSNATRGRLAEYLVACALGVASGVRREWVSHDLTTADGTKIEVKSAAYVQTWKQRRPSPISFDIRPTLAWDPDTATFADARRRQADVYVFSLLHEKDPSKLNPLNVGHWTFFVLSTRVLNKKCPAQKQISLNKLRALCPEEVRFEDIAAAVKRAASKHAIGQTPEAGLENPQGAAQRQDMGGWLLDLDSNQGPAD